MTEDPDLNVPGQSEDSRTVNDPDQAFLELIQLTEELGLYNQPRHQT